MNTEKKRRPVIPVGIFFTILFFMLLLSAVIAGSYFYIEAKNRITEIEKYTRNYSIPLAEAFANVAELCQKNNDLEKLKKLFRDKINANIIDEAFFVLSDGKIIVHSDKDIEKELKGNIATDEFAYNIDLIMLPIWTKTEYAQFMDYNIFGENTKIPFNKYVKKIIKKYIYQKIDVLGWLVTKAVYLNEKPAGCVTFIISKDRIYKFLIEHYNTTLLISFALAAFSLALSLLISIIVFFRYRNINRERKIELSGNINNINNWQQTNESNFDDRKIKEAIKIKQGSLNIKGLVSAGRKKIREAITVKDRRE
jgi:hypothetical protein